MAQKSPQTRPFPHAAWSSLWKHAMWRDFQSLVPSLQTCTVWPEPDQWNAWGQALTSFQEHAGDLSFVRELRPGARRRRREKKENKGIAGLRTYESRIIERAEVPTRPNDPHDFFNALIWLRYPASKRRLHHIAYGLQQRAATLTPGQRSREADSLTCFDEGGVFYRCPPTQDIEAVRRLFASRDDASKLGFCADHREGFSLFGHGLLEGLLMHDLAAVQVSCLVLPDQSAAGSDPKDIDKALARQIEESVTRRGDWGTIPFATLWRLEN